MNLHDEIARVAYELYLKRGCVHGHDLDDWLEAELIVLSRHAGQEIEEPEEESPAEEVKTIETAGTEETVIEETELPIIEMKKGSKAMKRGSRKKGLKAA